MVEQGAGVLLGFDNCLQVNQVAAGVERETQLAREGLSLESTKIDDASVADASASDASAAIASASIANAVIAADASALSNKLLQELILQRRNVMETLYLPGMIAFHNFLSF